MRAILICPSERPAVQLLSEMAPLAAVPVLGQSLIEYWLAYLASAGVTQVSLLASDRPEQIQQVAGDGARWGIGTEIIEESRELTPAEALIKHEKSGMETAAHNGIAVLDHFPGLPQFPLFTSYQDFFAAAQVWMPLAQTCDRVGFRQIQPRVWVGLRARISAKAKLIAPCWIGNHVLVGSRAVIGPRAVLEDGAFLESDTEISNSHVGPNTFVGRLARIKDSLAWADNLINCKNNSAIKVADSFLLCGLKLRGQLGLLARLKQWRLRPQRQAKPANPLDTLLQEQTTPI